MASYQLLSALCEALSIETITRLDAGNPKRTLSQLRLAGNVPSDCQVSLVNDSVVVAGKILSSGTMADVTFEVGSEKEEIRAHKLFLASASTVFSRMFFGSNPEANLFLIPDASPQAFNIMLQYIYTGVIHTALDDLDLGLELLCLARKYLLQNYEVMILAALVKSMEPVNIFRIYDAAIFHKSVPLEKVCWDYIDQNIKEIMLTIEFINVNETILLKLVERDNLQIEEVELFQGVYRWGWAAMKRSTQYGRSSVKLLQNILRPFMAKIRFPTMTLAEFCAGPGRSFALNEAEITQILHGICPTDFIAISCAFPKTPRPFEVKAQQARAINDQWLLSDFKTPDYHRFVSWFSFNYLENEISTEVLVGESGELVEIPCSVMGIISKEQDLLEILERVQNIKVTPVLVSRIDHPRDNALFAIIAEAEKIQERQTGIGHQICYEIVEKCWEVIAN